MESKRKQMTNKTVNKRSVVHAGVVRAGVWTALLCLSMFGICATAVGQGGTWATKTPMPTARYSLSTSVVNGVLYAVGGDYVYGVYGTVEAYDPASDTWTTKASMPTPRYGFGTSVVNGVIYAVGGGTYGGDCGTVEAYDPATNTWTTKASMPTVRNTLSTSVVNGVIYAVGGINDGNNPGALALGTVEAYDPASDTWTAKASMPTARSRLATSVVNGVIYAVGGEGDTIAYLGTVEAYDPADERYDLCRGGNQQHQRHSWDSRGLQPCR